MSRVPIDSRVLAALHAARTDQYCGSSSSRGQLAVERTGGVMGRTRQVFAVAAAMTLALACVLIWTSAAYADMCGGSASVAPDHGPPGTTFVFSTNVGAPSDLTLYHDGAWAGSEFLPGSGDVSYSIHSTTADIGHWRARAAVFNHPECFGEAEFDVDGSAGEVPAAVYAVLVGATLIVLLLLGRWTARRRPCRDRSSPRGR